MGLKPLDTKKYFHILGDGRIHETVHEGTQDAVKRSYETSDGKTGEKWELLYRSLSGHIVDIGFYDGDYGETMQITIRDDDDYVLSLPVGSNYAEDLMKKLPNVDLSAEVELAPYSFEDENGRNKKGITVTQNEEKINNYFYDPEAKKTTNGFPEPEGDTDEYSKDDWKVYFIQARKFLKNHTINNIIPKISNDIEKRVGEKKLQPVEEDINPDDIPF